LIYIACKVRLEARIPSRLDPCTLRFGAPSPSLAHPWERKKYDLAALEIGLCGVFAYVVWAFGCVSAALLEIPTEEQCEVRIRPCALNREAARPGESYAGRQDATRRRKRI
jgi:hypothetical protein